MEAGRSLLSTPSPPSYPRTPLRTQIFISSTARISQVSSKPVPSAGGHFRRSAVTQTCNDYYLLKEEKIKRVTADEKELSKIVSLDEEDQYKLHLEYAKSKLLFWSQLRDLTIADIKAAPSFEGGQLTPSLSLNLSIEEARVIHNSPTLSRDKKNVEPHKSEVSTQVTVVRSNRVMERRLKKRKVTTIPKYAKNDDEVSHSNNGCCKPSKKMERCINSNDPLRFFSWGFVYRKFLSREEEKEAIINIQELMRLEEAKERFKCQLNREPTSSEWAQIAGLTCGGAIDSCLILGKCSLDKIVKTNFRLVLQIAKQHVGKGVDLEDLVQAGYKGLVKSLTKFKISKGRRFKTYAHWWIRHSIRKAIQENSRTIRLPVRVFDLLRKIKREKMICIREGCEPTKEEIARRVGITTDKLSKVLWYGRDPISLNDRVTWYGENIIYQEIVADPTIEQPNLTILEQMRRQHVHECLNMLKPRERTVILCRFGFFDGEMKSLDQIGRMFGLTKERIRQIERCALQKLRMIASSEDLSAYAMFWN